MSELVTTQKTLIVPTADDPPPVPNARPGITIEQTSRLTMSGVTRKTVTGADRIGYVQS